MLLLPRSSKSSLVTRSPQFPLDILLPIYQTYDLLVVVVVVPLHFLVKSVPILQLIQKYSTKNATSIRGRPAKHIVFKQLLADVL